MLGNISFMLGLLWPSSSLRPLLCLHASHFGSALRSRKRICEIYISTTSYLLRCWSSCAGRGFKLWASSSHTNRCRVTQQMWREMKYTPGWLYFVENFTKAALLLSLALLSLTAYMGRDAVRLMQEHWRTCTHSTWNTY